MLYYYWSKSKLKMKIFDFGWYEIIFPLQFYVLCKNNEDKFNALSNLYGVVSIGQAMVFCHVSHTHTQHMCTALYVANTHMHC